MRETFILSNTNRPPLQQAYYEYGPCMGPPRGRTLHVLAFGLFRVRPFKEGDGERLEYITQNGIMSMADHGVLTPIP